MKKIFTPSSILLYLLSFLVFCLIGGAFAGMSGAGRDQGLAGGAIVFWYAMLSGLAGLFAAIFLAWRAERKTIATANRIIAIVLLALLAILYYRYQTI